MLSQKINNFMIFSEFEHALQNNRPNAKAFCISLWDNYFLAMLVEKTIERGLNLIDYTGI